MKTPLKLAAVALLLLTLDSLLSIAFAQGNLTPPGAPVPTMKSLDQIEARTPISSAPLIITNSGSYYLTTNLAVSSGNAITVATNNVTLDLNGFTISSTEPSPTGTGIHLGISSKVRNIVIQNDFITGGVTNNSGGVFSGSRFASGIIYSVASSNVRVTGVSVSGCLNYGIYLYPDGAVVTSCMVNTVGSYGINAQSVSDSTALNCGGMGIYTTSAVNCRGECLGFGYGLAAVTANNCYGNGSGNANGLGATVANNSYGQNSSVGTGLYAQQLATGCYGYSNTGTGLYAFNANNCIGTTGSTSPSQFGLYAYDIVMCCYGSSGVGGIGIYGIVLNSCDGNSLSYSFKYNMP